MIDVFVVYRDAVEALQNGRPLKIVPLAKTEDIRGQGTTIVSYRTSHDLGPDGIDDFLDRIIPIPKDDHALESPNGVTRKNIREALDNNKEVHLKLPNSPQDDHEQVLEETLRMD